MRFYIMKMSSSPFFVIKKILEFVYKLNFQKILFNQMFFLITIKRYTVNESENRKSVKSKANKQ
jgi:hypothetical protein